MTEVLSVIRMRTILWVYESLSDVGDFGPGDLIGLIVVRVTQSSVGKTTDATRAGNEWIRVGCGQTREGGPKVIYMYLYH
jgi:ribosomal 30S subunit maturation factor RimM